MSDEAGAITLVLAGIMFGLLVLGIVIAGTGQVLAARFQASTAADAAALAAAPATFQDDPYEAATRLAAANGARLVSCTCPIDHSWEPRTVETVAEVTVDVLGLGPQRIRATGRAEYLPLSLP